MAATLTLALSASAQQPGTNEVDLHSVVAKVAAAQADNHERVRAYTVTREYQLISDKGANDVSKVTADVSFVPPGTKEYAIRSASGGHGEKVVRKVLDHEAEMAGDWHKTAVTDENYNFELLGHENVNGRDCLVLKLNPKRESKDLISGRAYVDSNTYQVRRIIGEPAKSPSWWIRKVQVTLNFDQVRGAWIQTATHAEADVRLFGRHTLDSKDVDFRTGEVVAQAQRPVESTAATRFQQPAQSQSVATPTRAGALQTGVQSASRRREHRSTYSVMGGVVVSPR